MNSIHYTISYRETFDSVRVIMSRIDSLEEARDTFGMLVRQHYTEVRLLRCELVGSSTVYQRINLYLDGHINQIDNVCRELSAL